MSAVPVSVKLAELPPQLTPVGKRVLPAACGGGRLPAARVGAAHAARGRARRREAREGAAGQCARASAQPERARLDVAASAAAA